MSDILKEAIAEARYVRQVAYENAKAQLTEAFDPKINQALSSIIQTEAEECDAEEFEVEEAVETPFEEEPVEEEPVEEGVLDDLLKKNDKNVTGKFSGGTGNKSVTDDFKEGMDYEDGEEPVDDFSENSEYEEDETDLEIEAILDELDDEEDVEVEEPEFEDTPDSDAPIDVPSDDEPIEGGEEEDGDDDIDIDINVDADDDEEVEEQISDLDVDGVQDDEEVNIEELLNSLDEEEYPGKSNSEYTDKEQQKVVESVRSQNRVLKRKLSKYNKTVTYLKNQLGEVNLLNTKLLYTTKLFKNFTLANESKTRIVDQFDRTKSIREVKLVYATLHEALKVKGNKKKKSLKEAITTGASKSVGGTKTVSEKTILAEGNDFSDRMKKLAGIA